MERMISRSVGILFLLGLMTILGADGVAAFYQTSSLSLISFHRPSSHPPQSSKSDETETILGNSGISALYKPPAIMSSPPPSRVESIVSNAKILLPDWTVTEERCNRLVQSGCAGLTSALAVLPEAVAFSFVAGVNPLVGLWTSVTLGLVAAAFGGRAGICSSMSGACSVVVAGLCASHGPSYLSLCSIIAGLLQVSGGFLGISKFVRLIPHPVMLGFVNGLAIVMTKSQLAHFTVGGKFIAPTNKTGASLYGITALTMALVRFMPKISKLIPPSLGAVVLSTILSKLMNLPIKTLADVAGTSTFKGGWTVLPKIGFPDIPLTFATFTTVVPYAVTVAAVGLIESLLTMQIVDGMVDDGKRGSTQRECVAQGFGNLLSGMCGGIGGCAVLGQTIINVQSGGSVSKFSGMSMSVFLALGIVVCAPLLGSIPIASLAGIMLLVCQSTFSWSSLRLMSKIPRLDALVIALVSIATVQKDLVFAIGAGMVASALGFAWKQSTTLIANCSVEGDKKLYMLNGPLFFGTTSTFQSYLDPKDDPNEIVLDFTNSRVMDHSALVAINAVADQYGSRGKKVYLRHLSSDCTALLTKLDGGELPPYEIVEADPSSDPIYGVAEESRIYSDVPVSTM